MRVPVIDGKPSRRLVTSKRKTTRCHILLAILLALCWFAFGPLSLRSLWSIYPRTRVVPLSLEPVIRQNLESKQVILPPIASHIKLNQKGILEDFLAYGKLQEGSIDLSLYNQIDGVWLWVNGTDPRHALARSFYAYAPTGFAVTPFGRSGVIHERLWPDEDVSTEFSELDHDTSGTSSTSELSTTVTKDGADVLLPEAKVDGALSRKQLQNTNNRFRDNGELQYALRSARMWLGSSLRTQHLITTDFWPRGFPHPTASANSTFGLHGYQQILEEWHLSSSDEKVPGESAFSTTFPAEFRDLKRQGQYPQWIRDRGTRADLKIHHGTLRY